jgi:hypothetical protein
MNTKANKMPQWDMSVVFPGLESAEFEAGFEAAKAAVNELAALFDVYNIVGQEPLIMDGEVAAAFDEVIGRFDTVLLWDAVRVGPLSTLSGGAGKFQGTV